MGRAIGYLTTKLGGGGGYNGKDPKLKQGSITRKSALQCLKFYADNIKGAFLVLKNCSRFLGVFNCSPKKSVAIVLVLWSVYAIFRLTSFSSEAS